MPQEVAQQLGLELELPGARGADAALTACASPKVADEQHAAPASSAPDEFLHMPDLVRMIRRNRSTIYRWIERGAFPPQRVSISGVKLGWARSDIERWMHGSESPTQPPIAPRTSRRR